jgi:uncharacterized protein YukE
MTSIALNQRGSQKLGIAKKNTLERKKQGMTGLIQSWGGESPRNFEESQWNRGIAL